MKKQFYTVFFFLILQISIRAQNCDPSTPVFNIDLSGQPNGTWISPSVVRNGLCCSASNPEVCIQFNLTLDSDANGISFNIYSGAMPGGSMFYQLNCGTPTAVGQPVCLSGAGPHIITFCKPGNNPNQYSITSISDPSLDGTRYVSQACQGLLVAEGLVTNTIQWTSVPNNPVYNGYLSCSSGCDSVTITPPFNASIPYIDYQVCGTVAGACVPYTFCDTIRVYFINDLDVTINPVNPTICFGGTNATLTANGSGGMMPYSFLWSTGETTPSVIKGPGTYYVTITDQLNCSTDIDTVVVQPLPSPISVDAGPDGTLCLSDQFFQLNGNVVAATGGEWIGTGIFNPSSLILNPQYTPTSTEIINGYSDLMLISTGNFNCPSDTDMIRLTLATNPSPNITGPLQVCNFETVQYSTTFITGNIYQWSVTGGVLLNINLNTITIQWTTSGNNQLTLIETNINNCTTTDSIIVNVMLKPIPEIIGSRQVCNLSNEIYSLLNPVSGNNYLWSVSNGILINSSGTSVNVEWQTAGMGSVTVTEINSTGCDSTISIPVNIIDQPVPNITGNNTVCLFTSSVYTTNYDSSYLYNWTVVGGNIVSQNNNVVEVYWSGQGTGSITANIINQTMCDSSITLTVIIMNKPAPVIFGPNSSCSSVLNEYHVEGIQTNDVINWNINGGIILGSVNGDSINVIWETQGVGELTVNVVNPSGCDSIVTYLVTILDGADPQITGPDHLCKNDTSVYSVQGIQGHNYNWRATGGLILGAETDNEIEVYWFEEGSGVVSVTETSNSGCDSTVSMIVNVNPLPLPTLNGVPLVCQNDVTVFYTNPVNNHTYEWFLSGGNFAGDSLQSIVSCVWTINGQYILSMTETNEFGCLSIESIPVQVMPKPNVYVTGDIFGCTNRVSAFSINESPGTVYQYSIIGGIITSNNSGMLSVDWTTYGSNSLSVYAIDNITGCNSQNTINIAVDQLPKPVVDADNFSGCPPLSVSFQNNSDSGSYHYIWSFGEGLNSFDANPDYTYNVSGNFRVNVIATNNTGCIDSASTDIVVYPEPESEFDILNQGNIVWAEFQDVLLVNSSQGANVYSWDLGNGDTINNFEPPLFRYDKPGNYIISLEVINSWGCKSMMRKYIEAKVPEDIYVPNTFTPNGDSRNDYFSVAFKNIDHATISIFDRWGEKIYESDDMDFKWDGFYKGIKIQHDVYIYTIEAVGYYGTPINKIGKLTVLY